MTPARSLLTAALAGAAIVAAMTVAVAIGSAAVLAGLTYRGGVAVRAALSRLAGDFQ